MPNGFHRTYDNLPSNEYNIVLVTGGCGFIGSHVAERFAKLDKEVIVFDNMSRQGSEVNLEYLKQYENITFVFGDVRNFMDCFSVMRYQPDVIVHCAGQTAVTTSIVEPNEDFQINVVGTVNVLEAARRAGLSPKFIFCSTNKVFGDRVTKAGEPFGPTDLTGHSPYGCSKLCADHYVQEYGYSYDFDVLVLRMSCIYGTRQFGIEDQGWVAHFVISAYKDRTINIFGDGNQVRDILYIDDLVNAMVKYVRHDRKGVHVVQMGGGQNNTISLMELLMFLGTEMKKVIQLKFDIPRLFDQHKYISNIDKACIFLRWNPKTSTLVGIRKLIKWVQDNDSLWK